MKRFYKAVDVAQQDGGWRVTLDGRPIRTVGSRLQLVPSAALAQALAAEWAAQGEDIDPAGFILRDLADYAIDVVGPDRDQAIRELLPYGETDTLCYRAEPGDPLRRRQDAVWEPLLLAAELRHGLEFERIGGVIHRPQPAGTIIRLEALLGTQDDFALAALRTLAGLAASLVIGLTVLDDSTAANQLWTVAHLEEEWQAEHWGHDAEAAARHALRRGAFLAAARFADLARAG